MKTVVGGYPAMTGALTLTPSIFQKEDRAMIVGVVKIVARRPNKQGLFLLKNVLPGLAMPITNTIYVRYLFTKN
jgi:hypothetical protein